MYYFYLDGGSVSGWRGKGGGGARTGGGAGLFAPNFKLFPDRHSLCICLPQSPIRGSDRWEGSNNNIGRDNLIIGASNKFKSVGGFIAGNNNTISKLGASVLG